MRTEDQKITQAPIVVILGGKEYEIAPLVIRDSREWRKKVIALISPLPQMVNVKIDTPEEFGQALTEMLITMSDQVVDLFFEYAKDLNREEIEGIATDAELRDAFGEVIKIAFPLAEALPATMGHILPTPKTKHSR